MRRTLLALLLATTPLLAAAGTTAGPAPLIANVAGREIVNLDGSWRTIVDPYESGIFSFHNEVLTDGYFRDAKPTSPGDRVEYDFDTSPQLAVPGDWNSQRPDLYRYEGAVWYRRLFELPPQEGRRYFVHFGAVNQRARVFLNGEHLGDHEGGFTPFDFEITGVLKADSNSLVVEADNTRRKAAVPTLMTDWWNYGGITRPVRIVSLPETFVQDYFLQLERGSRRVVSGFVQLDGPRSSQEVLVRIPEAGVKTRVRTDASGRAAVRFETDLQLWSPEHPKLYEVEIAAETDSVTDQIGFRAIEVKGTDILLNGEPIFLRGVCVHEEAPYRGGRALSEDDARTLLGWARELGANFLRLAHYPHNETMIREADRQGILLWSEIPVYWAIDWDNPETLASAKQQLTESITRDRNRAAIVLWSVANETPVSEARNAFLGELVQTARKLDPSRLLTAALLAHYADPHTMVIDDPIGARLDVMGTNEYIGWYDGLPDKADGIRFTSLYDKPLIMSEFGGAALAGRHGSAEQRWTEEFQASVYEHQLAMLRRIPFLRGMTPWILMDFRSPRRVLPGIQDDWNRKGLISEQGQRKQAFYVLQRFYAVK